MKVREFREGLALFSKMLSGWQSKSAARDLDWLALLFKQHDGLSVAEFCSLVEKSLSGGTQRPARTTPVDGSSVQSLLQELRQAESSQELFEPFITRIERLRNAELFALAN